MVKVVETNNPDIDSFIIDNVEEMVKLTLKNITSMTPEEIRELPDIKSVFEEYKLKKYSLFIYICNSENESTKKIIEKTSGDRSPEIWELIGMSQKHFDEIVKNIPYNKYIDLFSNPNFSITLLKYKQGRKEKLYKFITTYGNKPFTECFKEMVKIAYGF
jgi:hypothetical protein